MEEPCRTRRHGRDHNPPATARCSQAGSGGRGRGNANPTCTRTRWRLAVDGPASMRRVRSNPYGSQLRPVRTDCPCRPRRQPAPRRHPAHRPCSHPPARPGIDPAPHPRRRTQADQRHPSNTTTHGSPETGCSHRFTNVCELRVVRPTKPAPHHPIRNQPTNPHLPTRTALRTLPPGPPPVRAGCMEPNNALTTSKQT